MEHELDHAGQAVALLTDEGREVQTLVELLRDVGGSVQAIEDAFWQLYTERSLDDATGAQLDNLGTLVGQPRNGYGDADYRTHLRARVKANRSSGNPDAILEILRLVVPAPTTLDLDELYPAAFRVTAGVSNLSATLVSILVDFIRAARAGGVAHVFHYMGGTTDGTTFTLDGGGGLGLGDTGNPATGGGLSGAVS